MNSNKSAKKLFKLRKEGLKNKNYKKFRKYFNCFPNGKK